MKIEYKNIDEITPYENNPRNNDEAAEYVANSIKQFGFKVPIIIDKDNVIVTGHTRLKAAKKLGINKVPCIRATDLTEDQVKAFRIADNKVSEYATWDYDKLSIELDDIELDMSDFGLEFGDFETDTEEMEEDQGYYGDERERTYKAYNLDEYDSARTVGFYQLPILKAEPFIPTDLIGFNYAKTSDSKNTGIHFFIDDYQFERIWNDPLDYVDILAEYECVLTPDFSLYMDMPMAMKIWNVYRARLIGQILQDRGVKVIPTLTWAEPDTFQFCFDGIEPGGTVATSTVGVMRDVAAQEIWKQGMTDAIKRIHPKNILLYGSEIDFDFGKINVKYFNSKSFRGS